MTALKNKKKEELIGQRTANKKPNPWCMYFYKNSPLGRDIVCGLKGSHAKCVYNCGEKKAWALRKISI